MRFPPQVYGCVGSSWRCQDDVRQKMLFLFRLQLGKAQFMAALTPGKWVSCGQK